MYPCPYFYSSVNEIQVNKTEKQTEKKTNKHLERLTTLEAKPTSGRKKYFLFFYYIPTDWK